jgi:hypothetical protein
MQRVFEIQSNWDEREKMRHFAMAKTPLSHYPKMPIQNILHQTAPHPELQNLGNEGIPPKRGNVSPKIGFSFKEQKAALKKSQETKSLKVQKSKTEQIDYEKLIKEVYECFQNIDKNQIDINKVKKAILGKSESDIRELVTLLKAHPEIISKNTQAKPKPKIIQKNLKSQNNGKNLRKTEVKKPINQKLEERIPPTLKKTELKDLQAAPVPQKASPAIQKIISHVQAKVAPQKQFNFVQEQKISDPDIQSEEMHQQNGPISMLNDSDPAQI